MSDLSRVLYPRSVAIVGASQDPSKRGNQAIRQLQQDGFDHPIFPIHPTNDSVLGVPCFKAIEAVPYGIDLAMVAVPSGQVEARLRECARKGVKGVVVIANDFGETETGRDRERVLSAISQETGMWIVGPNTNGIFNLHHRLNLVGAPDIPVGPLALITQSGNVGLSVWNEAAASKSSGVGIYLGLGNEAGLRFHEAIEFLRSDHNVGAIAIYAEGFRDGRRLLEEISVTATIKPVVVMKAGRTPQGIRSARSHTGAMAADYTLSVALLEKAGAVVVERLDELFPVAAGVADLPAPTTPAVAVLSDGGGHATIAADALGDCGLELATLRERTRRELTDLLPATASVQNPIDVAGATDTNPLVFADCLEPLMADPSVGSVLLVGLLGGYDIRFGDPGLRKHELAVARRIIELVHAWRKPVVVQSAYAAVPAPAFQALRPRGIPVHASVEMSVRVVSGLCQAARAKDRPPILEFASRPVGADSRRQEVLSEPQARRLLATAGVIFPPWEVASSTEDAVAAFDVIGPPVALKAIVEGLTHKTERGGVILGLSAREAVSEAYRRCAEELHRTGEVFQGVIVERMVETTLEMAVGVLRDNTFGPVLMVGRGGTQIELYRDVSWAPLPTDVKVVKEMITSLRSSPLLRGFRGEQQLAEGSLIDVALSLANLLEKHPEILEVDLNPVFVGSKDCVAVDAKVIRLV